MEAYHKDIRYNPQLLYCLRVIKTDLRQHGRSDICPPWYAGNKRCHVCEALFPRIVAWESCPCQEYSPAYLIRRLNKIIKHYEKERKEEAPS